MISMYLLPILYRYWMNLSEFISFQWTGADSPEYEYTEIKEHEAGYDSYMTGVCFIALSLELHVKSDELNSKSHHLRNFLNK